MHCIVSDNTLYKINGFSMAKAKAMLAFVKPKGKKKESIYKRSWHKRSALWLERFDWYSWSRKNVGQE